MARCRWYNSKQNRYHWRCLRPHPQVALARRPVSPHQNMYLNSRGNGASQSPHHGPGAGRPPARVDSNSSHGVTRWDTRAKQDRQGSLPAAGTIPLPDRIWLESG